MLIVVLSAETARGFVTFGQVWHYGTITLLLQLTSSGALQDGSPNFNASVAAAAATWNQHVDLVDLATLQGSTPRPGDGDFNNNVFFDSTYYGARFAPDTLAITTRWYVGSQRVEADLVFNTAVQWDSYRGNVQTRNGRAVWDIHRVALHELGHVLGLDHPDEHGQSVDALMNSVLGNRDALTGDDIAGARSLYGEGVASNVSFPPRNEANDFFSQLAALYRDELRAAPVATYIDPEGAVVWLSEYARYRVGLCGHGTAAARVFSQIDGSGSHSVCGITPPGPIPFPSRTDGVAFMNELNDRYRDLLRRGVSSSFVDNEGAVVWVLEYFRYRLNRCQHGDATTKVFQQIRGQGIQPVCQ